MIRSGGPLTKYAMSQSQNTCKKMTSATKSFFSSKLSEQRIGMVNGVTKYIGVTKIFKRITMIQEQEPQKRPKQNGKLHQLDKAIQISGQRETERQREFNSVQMCKTLALPKLDNSWLESQYVD